MDKCDRKYKLSDLSIAIVDDHEVVLEGFKSYMLKNGTECVETFADGHSLLNRINAKTFDVYVVDVELPDMDVTTLIDDIRKLHPQAKIIINTIHEEMWVVRKMTEKQVDGVLYKSGQLEQLLQAVITVVEGRQYFCRQYKQKNERLTLQNETLSPRELDVIQEIAMGHSTKDIARNLYISENTVESHRQKLFFKLKAHNMAELIVKAISCGYLDAKSLG